MQGWSSAIVLPHGQGIPEGAELGQICFGLKNAQGLGGQAHELQKSVMS